MIFFIGREIFENPVTLLCSHSYCQSCLNGLKNSPSSSLSDLALTPPSPPPSGSLIYRPKSHETDQCFTCAICRKVSLGYTDCRDIDIDLKTLEGPCSHCSKSFLLCDLRKHTEKCVEARRILNPENMRKIFDKNFVKQLSTPQVQALEKARAGENRSTFSCPYCHRAKYNSVHRFAVLFYIDIFLLFSFSVQHLCRHIEKHHLDDDPQQVWYA